MVPIWSQLIVSYLTSIVSNIVSLTVLKIFDAEEMWPRSRTAQDQPTSEMMVSIDSTWVTSYSTSIDPNILSVTIFETFDV